MSFRDRFDRLHSRWANLHPLMKLVVLAVVLAAAAYPTAKPAYRMFREWRMERNLVAAGEALDAQRMKEARDLSLAVLRAGDPGIEAFRILEKSSGWLGDPRHKEIARALIFHPKGTDEDRLTGFKAVVMDMPLGQILQVWGALPEHLRARPDFAALFAHRLREGKRLREAGELLMAIPPRQRNVAARQELALVLIASGRDEGFMEAQRMVNTGIESDETSAADGWLEVLEKVPPTHLRTFLIPAVIAKLERLTEVDEVRRSLMARRIAWADAVTVDAREVIVNVAVKDWRRKGKLPLAVFLTDLGEDDRLLRTFAPDTKDVDVTMMRLMWAATQRMQSWELAKAWLDAHGATLPPHELAACRAILAARTGDSSASQLAWKSAEDAAKQVPTGHALLELHRLAAEAGFTEEASSAMIEAIRTGSGPLPLYEDHRALVQSLTDAGREKVVLEICGIYVALEPWNPMLLTQYAYLACVHNIVEPDRLLPPLEALSKSFPQELPVQSTLATVLMAAGQPEKAAAALDPFKLGEKELPPVFQIVYLTSEVMNGRIAADDERVTSFPWDKLQTADRKKFTELIGSKTK
jgi:hypothetical protein